MIGAVSIVAGFLALAWEFGAIGAAAGAVLLLVLVLACGPQRH